ncbi:MULTISPECIES: hypothetical protein [unclassified Amycolatopsis]|uniref:hypothetical protein n=1 Tax=unclassified Amycolatopsis TaxID=2618356 RepID=UPI001FF212D9|nr:MULTISPECIES: hypothetical protein [unclassified Amycolatopsis]UOZ11079.1 hypothetical protein MUY22_23535 [Amycolatopsis sp. WQ 127309]WSJ77372.1 hypothetical protein OG439_49830 [Amycolatopsis sp. NBC_01307]WSK79080.1 hypothetical protein OG570_00340 [Amycolatopsis sp. NBC_01286]
MTTPASSPRQRWLVPVVVVVLSVTVGGGLLARELYRRPDQPAGDTSAPVTVPQSATGSQPTGADIVGMTPDAQSHPRADEVRKVLETYFSAINTQQYSRWMTVVTTERVAQQPLGTWKDGIKTTKDSDAVVYRIERGSGTSLRVLVGFRSRQAVEDAPAWFPEPCIQWRLVLPMVIEKSALKIAAVDNGPPPEHQKC